MGIKLFGNNIKISKFCNIYNPQNLILHNNIRIDDFTILSCNDKIEIHDYVHIASQCYISSSKGILFNKYTTISSGVKLFGGSDDYSGNFMTNPTVPKDFLNVKKGHIILEPHVIIGSNSVILPNVILREGTAVGSLSLIHKDTEPWKIYSGNPSKIIKDRSMNCLILEKKLNNSLIN